MATKAKAKPALKKKTSPPGKFKRRTKGYEFTIEADGRKLIHRLDAMTDVGLLMWQRGMAAAENLSGEVAALATIEVWTQAWLKMATSVDGYEGIEDGGPITAEGVANIPFAHINHCVSHVLMDLGVYAGDDQKN